MRAGARDGIVAFASGVSSVCRDAPDLMVAISKPLCLNFQTICDFTKCRCATSDQVSCEQFSPPKQTGNCQDRMFAHENLPLNL